MEVTLLSKKVYLFYPLEGPATSIVLHQPIFGDTNVVNLQTQVKHSRNGDVYAYKRTPTYQSLKLTFEKMREAPLQGFSGKEQIKTFLELSAAKHIKYIDHAGRGWSGIIISPTVEYVNQGRDAFGDLFGFTLEFEGKLI